MLVLHLPSFTKALNETTNVNPMDIIKKTLMIPKQTQMTPKLTPMHTSMSSKLPTLNFENTYEQCIQKLLTTQGLNAPIIQHIKKWLKQHEQITKC
jgi:hypothetical protein